MVGFSFGALSKPLEEQAKEQGYTLGDNSDPMQKDVNDLIRLRIHGYVADSEYDKILRRINKKLGLVLKPIK